MKRARFIAHGRLLAGTWREDDRVLLDAQGRAWPEEQVVWLPPVPVGKMIGLALNFADHAGELGLAAPEAPTLFVKPNNTLIGHRAPVVYPRGAEYMHYEVELAVVIGRTARRVSAERALDYVGGYTIANDITVRDYIHPTLYRPAVKAKGFDTFGPLGPFLVSPDEVPDPDNVGLRVYVNGELRQEGNTRRFIHNVPQIIEFISDFMTLDPGDVILTGTPKGLSHIYPGDVMRLEVDGLGALENPVVEES